jgi:hypothetical protein
MNDYKDQNLKSAVMTAGVVACLVIAFLTYIVIN